MNYDEWITTVPEAITNDPIWNLKVYRLAVFVADIGWQDVTKLMQDKRTLGLSDQLYRALGSIGGNVSEGYSRGSGKDRARFYEYGLGSARESRNWYYNGRHILGEKVAGHRMSLLSEIARLLLTMLPAERAFYLREPEPTEPSRLSDSLVSLPISEDNATELLINVPMP
jgi:four helix bundle protein